MESLIAKVNAAAASCGCGGHHPVTLDVIEVRPGAIESVTPYCAARGYKRVAVVADDNTWAAAGERLAAALKGGDVDAAAVFARPNEAGDVVADERTIVQVMLEIDRDRCDLLIAAGSGTLHDIVRFVAFKMGKPFLSVPTAPSVDGFNSKGAPLIIRGEKITIPAIAPVAIFADTDVLAAAPAPLVAAGFGDMLGKYTSLLDWRFGALTAGEPYCEAAAASTRSALELCVSHADSIGSQDAEGIRLLMNALIESGLAMLLFGQSHPASGAEHHLSHYWEMEYLRLGRRQLLHGAKVGAASAVIAGLYRRLAEEGWLERAQPEDEANAAKYGALRTEAGQVRALLAELPSPERLRELLRTVGGPEEPGALGINGELLARSLREAHKVRPNRFTLLNAYNSAAK